MCGKRSKNVFECWQGKQFITPTQQGPGIRLNYTTVRGTAGSISADSPVNFLQPCKGRPFISSTDKIGQILTKTDERRRVVFIQIHCKGVETNATKLKALSLNDASGDLMCWSLAANAAQPKPNSFLCSSYLFIDRNVRGKKNKHSKKNKMAVPRFKSLPSDYFYPAS